MTVAAVALGALAAVVGVFLWVTRGPKVCSSCGRPPAVDYWRIEHIDGREVRDAITLCAKCRDIRAGMHGEYFCEQ